LDVEEIDLPAAAGPVLAGPAAGPRDRGAARLPIGREPSTDLEQPDVAPAVAPVVGDGVHEPGEKGGPKRVEFRRERVGDTNETIEREARRARQGGRALSAVRALWSLVRGGDKQLCRLRLDEPERDGFGTAGGREHTPDQPIARHARIRRRRRLR